MNAMVLLDYSGVALFAATGALAASRKQLDIIGFLFLGAITGIGGGTARDLLLGVDVFWIKEPTYILVCGATALIIYFCAHLLESRYRWLLWMDAIALAAYCVLGANKGLAITGSPVIAVVMGMFTGTLGGILRDVLADEPSVLLRKEVYVTAAMAGATAFVVANVMDFEQWITVSIGVAVALATRGSAIAYGWTLPSYRSRPGRHPDKIGQRRKSPKR
jgi:uncharacterized membrane protein YeiH